MSLWRVGGPAQVEHHENAAVSKHSFEKELEKAEAKESLRNNSPTSKEQEVSNSVR